MKRWPLVRLLQLATLLVLLALLTAAWVLRAAYLERHARFRAELQPRMARLMGLERAQQEIEARRAAYEKALAAYLFAATASPETEARQILQRLTQQQNGGVNIVTLQTSLIPPSPQLPELLQVRAVVSLSGEYAALHHWQRSLLAHRPLLILESAQWMRDGGNELTRDHQRMRLTVQVVLPFARAPEASGGNAARSGV